MVPDFGKKVPRERDKTARGIAERAKQVFRSTSGRPPLVDDDESVRVVPRRDGESSPSRRPLDDEED
jgi:hypothetical protein